MLTQEEVKKIAKLARLGLSQEELEKFAPQLSSILEYIDVLNELDTEKVIPAFQVTGLENVMRKDEIGKICEREELLATTPLLIENNQIKVKSVF